MCMPIPDNTLDRQTTLRKMGRHRCGATRLKVEHSTHTPLCSTPRSSLVRVCAGWAGLLLSRQGRQHTLLSLLDKRRINGTHCTQGGTSSAHGANTPLLGGPRSDWLSNLAYTQGREELATTSNPKNARQRHLLWQKGLAGCSDSFNACTKATNRPRAVRRRASLLAWLHITHREGATCSGPLAQTLRL